MSSRFPRLFGVSAALMHRARPLGDARRRERGADATRRRVDPGRVDDVLALPKHIDLPDGFQPEGIVSWGPWLFAGSVANGAIWRGNALTGKGHILVPGVTGSAAAGLHIDRLGRLWVAGASSSQVRVYNAVTGKLLRTFALTGVGFLNDLDIVGNTVYVTDSNIQQLVVIKLGRFGRLPAADAATKLPLIGAIHYDAGFNANGIVAANGWLLIDQSNTGFLFRVNPKTGNTKKVDTHGYSLLNGDGMERVGRTLYVVRNQNNLVAVLHLSLDLLERAASSRSSPRPTCPCRPRRPPRSAACTSSMPGSASRRRPTTPITGSRGCRSSGTSRVRRGGRPTRPPRGRPATADASRMHSIGRSGRLPSAPASVGCSLVRSAVDLGAGDTPPRKRRTGP